MLSERDFANSHDRMAEETTAELSRTSSALAMHLQTLELHVGFHAAMAKLLVSSFRLDMYIVGDQALMPGS